ncbi:hypothetical protein [Paenisporosarcina sp.]|uniref:hypothetical protein n=1 Tax=Paenisporosarcina sp. TaxID=1932001 RepID=UPI003C72AFF7
MFIPLLDLICILSDGSVVIIDLHVGKNEGDVGIIGVHVGKIDTHVGITLKIRFRMLGIKNTTAGVSVESSKCMYEGLEEYL